MTTPEPGSTLEQRHLQAALRDLHAADRLGRVFDIRALRRPLVTIDRQRVGECPESADYCIVQAKTA